MMIAHGVKVQSNYYNILYTTTDQYVYLIFVLFHSHRISKNEANILVYTVENPSSRAV